MGDTEIIGFSELIKNYRKEKKLTQAAFGLLIDRNQATVSNYEKKIHFPDNPGEIRAIAAILNQPADFVLEAIEYSRSGTIEQYEAIFIDLDKLNDEDLVKRYKFLVAGEEVTSKELQKMLYILGFERYIRKQGLKDE